MTTENELPADRLVPSVIARHGYTLAHNSGIGNTLPRNGNVAASWQRVACSASTVSRGGYSYHHSRVKEEVELVMQNDRLVVAVGAVIVLAVLALAAYVVNRLVPSEPTVAAGILTGIAAVLAALPPIIKALRGR